MLTVLIVIHLMIGLAMVGVILLQRNDASGMGGLGGGTMGGMMTTRGTANLLTRTTGILAGFFMLTSILLTIGAQRSSHSLFQDTIQQTQNLEASSQPSDQNAIITEKTIPTVPTGATSHEETIPSEKQK